MNACASLIKLLWDNGAIAGVVGVLWSMLCEDWPAFGALPFGQKRLAMLALCLLVPFTALLLGARVYSCEGMAWTRANAATAVVQGCVAFSASQVGHILVKRPSGPT